MSTSKATIGTIIRYDINWGDGDFSSYPAALFSSASHTYTSTGTPEIEITAVAANGSVYHPPSIPMQIDPTTAVTAISLAATSSSDTFAISSDGTNTIITKNDTTIDDEATANILSLSITGQGASVSVNFANGDPLPIGGLYTDAASVELDGPHGSDPLVTTSTAALIGSDEIRYPATTTLTDNLSSHGGIIAINGTTNLNNPAGDALTVTPGATVYVNGSQTFSSLTIDAGATVREIATNLISATPAVTGTTSATQRQVLTLASLTIEPADTTDQINGGVLDLGNSDLIIQGGNINGNSGNNYCSSGLGILPLLNNGFGNGDWQGTSGSGLWGPAILTSQSAPIANDPVQLRTLNYGSIGAGADPLILTAIDGQQLHNGDIIVLNSPLIGGGGPQLLTSTDLNHWIPPEPFLSLTGWDHSIFANHVTSNAGQTSNLYVAIGQNNTATVGLYAYDQTGFPNANITYTVAGAGAAPNSGDFGSPVTVKLTPGDSEFYITATEYFPLWSEYLTATIDAFPVAASLHIDSNNNGQIAGDDDAIKNDPTLPGKIMPLDNTDININNIPDYADGYGLFGTGPSGATFTPMTFEVSPNTDFANDKFMFAYDASDPMAVTRTGTGTTADPYVYNLPTNGSIRLWLFDGSASTPRLGLPIEAGGNYIAPNDQLTAAQLGLSAGKLSVTIYVEGVKISSAKGDQQIQMQGTIHDAGVSDTVRATIIETDVLIGTTDPHNFSIHDDWVAAAQGTQTNTIENTVAINGPVGMPIPYQIDWQDVAGGGTISIVGLNADGTQQTPGSIKGTATIPASGGVAIHFYVVGGIVSSSTEDVQVILTSKNVPFAVQTLTVIHFDSETETSGSSPTPVNPEVVNSSSSSIGNVFAADVGTPRDDPANPISGTPSTVYHTSDLWGGSIVPMIINSKKVAPDIISASWVRLISSPGRVDSVDFSFAGMGPAILRANPQNNGLTQVHNDNLRVQDSPSASYDNSGGTATYYLIHPSVLDHKTDPLLGYRANFSTKIVAQVLPEITFKVNLHLVRYTPLSNVLTTTGVTRAYASAMLAEANSIWSQAGIAFELNRVIPENVTNQRLFDVEDGDSLSTNTTGSVVALSQDPQAIDIYIVDSIRVPSGNLSQPDADLNGATVYPGASSLGAGILIATHLLNRVRDNGTAGTPLDRFTFMGRTLAHELGHYLMKVNGTDGHAPYSSTLSADHEWNIMYSNEDHSTWPEYYFKRDISTNSGAEDKSKTDQIVSSRKLDPAFPDV